MIALDPAQTFVVELPVVGGGTPFRCTCSFPTCRQWIRMDELMRLAREEEGGATLPERIGFLVQAVRLVMVDAPDCPGSGTPEADPAAVLTITELWELVYLILHESRLQEADRRKSASPSRSPAAPPASGAVPDGAATASQPGATPSS